jgi:NADPH-dependent curcumin reductase CurA
MDDRKSYARPLQIGDVMTGESVARVVASNHPGYAEGDVERIYGSSDRYCTASRRI